MGAMALAGLIVVAALVFLVWRASTKARSATRLFAELPASEAVAGATSVPTTFPIEPPYELVHSKHGWMLVNRNDEYLGKAILLYGECCEAEMELLLQLLPMREGLVLEVGTNIGTHTVPMARALAAQGRRMLAFEPQPVIFNNMCANVALSALTNVRTYPFACGEVESTIEFPLPDYGSPGNFGGVSMRHEEGAVHVSVPCRRLDDVLNDEPIALMKIDVEGFELAVLKGAESSIDRSRPILYVENDRLEHSDALMDWLRSKDYRLWWHIPHLFNAANFFGNAENIYGAVASFNMLCFPAERPIPSTSLPEATTNKHPLDRAPAG